MSLNDILFAAGSIFGGLALGLFVIRQRPFDEKTVSERSSKLVSEAKTESAALLNAAREHTAERKKQFAVEEQEFSTQLEHMDKMVAVKIASGQKREARIVELRRVIQEEENSVNAARENGNALGRKFSTELIRITGIAPDRVKENLITEYEQAFKNDADLRIQKALEWCQECAVRDARNILADSMDRLSGTPAIENDQATVIVSRDEVKGRIIGRGGRTISYFEELFGVDVIFNDEPNIILLSSFNLVQREIARQALDRLMREKNITEEVVARIKPLAEADVDKILRRDGERVLAILGVKNMPPDFAKLVGRLRFRTSYGQNIMRHSFEVGYFAKLLASEIGANEEVALLGGFFHDIGKAIDQEVGGSHDVLSKEILEKYNFSWEITHAAWTHHNAIPQETIEARIVQAADAMSAGRPGARAESVERYLAKIKDLQETAFTFDGVRKAFAINAGRELRVVVDSEKIDDVAVQTLASDIAKKVQEKGGYPGKIKITTIRATKVTDYAR